MLADVSKWWCRTLNMLHAFFLSAWIISVESQPNTDHLNFWNVFWMRSSLKMKFGFSGVFAQRERRRKNDERKQSKIRVIENYLVNTHNDIQGHVKCRLMSRVSHIVICNKRVIVQQGMRWNWIEITFSQQVSHINLHGDSSSNSETSQCTHPNVQTKQQRVCVCVFTQSCHKTLSIPLFIRFFEIYLLILYEWKISVMKRNVGEEERKKKCQTSKIDKNQREKKQVS